MPKSIRQYIETGTRAKTAETPKPMDAVFNNTVNRIIGSNRLALHAAAEKAISLGYYIKINSEVITGDAATEAEKLVTTASRYTGEKPFCFLQSGETTIKVTGKGKGKGGRNQHFALIALTELMKLHNKSIPEIMTILIAGTDGTDGPTDTAGAIIDNEKEEQVLQKSLSIKEYLENHDAYHFFEKTNGLLKTGSTQTNVMDIMIMLIRKRGL